MHPHSSVKKLYTKTVWGALLSIVLLFSCSTVGCVSVTEVVSRDLAKDVNFQVTELLPPEIAVNELRSLMGKNVRKKSILLVGVDANTKKVNEKYLPWDDLAINCYHSSIYTGYVIAIFSKGSKGFLKLWQFGSNAKSTARACTALVSLGATLKPRSAGTYTTTFTEGVAKQKYTP